MAGEIVLTKLCNELQRPTTSYNDLRVTTSYNDLQRVKNILLVLS